MAAERRTRATSFSRARFRIDVISSTKWSSFAIAAVYGGSTNRASIPCERAQVRTSSRASAKGATSAFASTSLIPTCQTMSSGSTSLERFMIVSVACAVISPGRLRPSTIEQAELFRYLEPGTLPQHDAAKRRVGEGAFAGTTGRTALGGHLCRRRSCLLTADERGRGG